MGMKYVLETADVETIAAAAEDLALKREFKVTISIVDDGGHLLYLKRLDGASPMSVETSVAKAKTAALSRRDTGFYENLIINKQRMAFLNLEKFCFLEGAVPISIDQTVVGAIGVSGVASSDDLDIAQHALHVFYQTSNE
ncbi:hypothetical protein CBF45_04120 [Bordetella sp. J329]|nr:hypothetical protein CBF45_04120 [Bordetella sp. J329]